MNKYIPKQVKKIAKQLLKPIPSHLLRNHIQIDKDALRAVEKSIKENYHTGWRSQSSYSKTMYENDLRAHLYGRLESDRKTVVPWLDKAGLHR